MLANRRYVTNFLRVLFLPTAYYTQAALWRPLRRMKPELESDKMLKALLSEWRPTATLPPRFSESVWRQIEAGGQSATLWQIARAWIDRSLARPAVAFAYCALLIGTGIGLGSWRGQEQTANTQAQLQARYVQAISPYHKAHH